jgi:CRP-like cAMP-binding protein
MQHNRILSALVQRHPEFRERLKRRDYVHGDMVGKSGDPIVDVLFPSSGLISIVVALRGGELVEAAMVGCDGVVGGGAAFGAKQHLGSSFVQLPGFGWTMRAADLATVVKRDEDMRRLLFVYEQFLLAQARQTAACNARHHIPQRLGSWLLRARDAAREDELLLTQEFLAQMLGVQRASVSMFAGQMQDKDLIRYRRGRVAVVNADGLAKEACECHAVLGGLRRRLFEVRDGDEEALRTAV